MNFRFKLGLREAWGCRRVDSRLRGFDIGGRGLDGPWVPDAELYVSIDMAL